MKIEKWKGYFNREIAANNPNAIFIFTDNGDRTSGGNNIPDDSEYSKRFSKKGLKYPKVTTAVLRGLDNAFPITTQKKLFYGSISYKGNWSDDDFDEFKKVIDDDFEHIKEACREKKYKVIYFPQGGVLNGPISRITMERTPKLFNYIVEKEKELKEFEC